MIQAWLQCALLIVFLSTPTNVWAAWAEVQNSKQCTAGSSQNPTCAYTSNVTAGSLMALCLFNDATSGTSSVTGGGTWERAIRIQDNAGTWIEFWYAKNATGGATTVTMNHSAVSSFTGVTIMEYSGIATGTPLDGASSVERLDLPLEAGDTYISAPVTTTVANDLIIACIETNGNTPGVGTGHTDEANPYTNTNVETKNQASPGSTTSTFIPQNGSPATTDLWILQVAFAETNVVSRRPVAPLVLSKGGERCQ